MSSENQVNPTFSVKRVALIIITALVGVVMAQSLISSWSEPQVASRLQLYQTDLLLQSSRWGAQEIPADQRQVVRTGLLGEKPLDTALKQYQEVRESASKSLDQLAPRAADPLNENKPMPRDRLAQQQQSLLHELDLRIGLLLAEQDQTSEAIDSWNRVAQSETAAAPQMGAASDLIGLWQDESVDPQTKIHIQQALEGWFRYRALEKLYQVSDRDEQLAALLAQEQDQARSQIIKLAAVATLPGVGAIIGILLLVWLIIQRLTQPDSLLARNGGVGWEIPWDGETIWQVLVVGFFFVGQIVLPLILGLSG
ncbi:CPBP family intramembrane metalloprotease domain-containing protein, partial [filamentous cyanobacterium CCT1]